MEFVIVNRESLDSLRRDPSLKHRIRRIRIAPRFELPDRATLETRLNREYFACGCASGALAVYAALAVIGMSWWLAPDQGARTWWQAALVVVAASVLGKVAGIVVSRRQLNRTLDRLERAL